MNNSTALDSESPTITVDDSAIRHTTANDSNNAITREPSSSSSSLSASASASSVDPRLRHMQTESHIPLREAVQSVLPVSESISTSASALSLKEPISAQEQTEPQKELQATIEPDPSLIQSIATTPIIRKSGFNHRIRSMTTTELSSPTTASLSKSPTTGSLSKSPTTASLSKSLTTASLSKSPTTAPLFKSPTTPLTASSNSNITYRSLVDPASTSDPHMSILSNRQNSLPTSIAKSQIRSQIRSVSHSQPSSAASLEPLPDRSSRSRSRTTPVRTLSDILNSVSDTDPELLNHMMKSVASTTVSSTATTPSTAATMNASSRPISPTLRSQKWRARGNSYTDAHHRPLHQQQKNLSVRPASMAVLDASASMLLSPTAALSIPARRSSPLLSSTNAQLSSSSLLSMPGGVALSESDRNSHSGGGGGHTTMVDHILGRLTAQAAVYDGNLNQSSMSYLSNATTMTATAAAAVEDSQLHPNTRGRMSQATLDRRDRMTEYLSERYRLIWSAADPFLTDASGEGSGALGSGSRFNPLKAIRWRRSKWRMAVLGTTAISAAPSAATSTAAVVDSSSAMNLAEYLVSASPWFVSNKELAEYLISAKFNSEGSGCRRASLTMEDPEPVDMGNSLLIDFLGDVSLFPTATSNPVSPISATTVSSSASRSGLIATGMEQPPALPLPRIDDEDRVRVGRAPLPSVDIIVSTASDGRMGESRVEESATKGVMSENGDRSQMSSTTTTTPTTTTPTTTTPTTATTTAVSPTPLSILSRPHIRIHPLSRRPSLRVMSEWISGGFRTNPAVASNGRGGNSNLNDHRSSGGSGSGGGGGDGNTIGAGGSVTDTNSGRYRRSGSIHSISPAMSVPPHRMVDSSHGASIIGGLNPTGGAARRLRRLGSRRDGNEDTETNTLDLPHAGLGSQGARHGLHRRYASLTSGYAFGGSPPSVPEYSLGGAATDLSLRGIRNDFTHLSSNGHQQRGSVLGPREDGSSLRPTPLHRQGSMRKLKGTFHAETKPTRARLRGMTSAGISSLTVRPAESRMSNGERSLELRCRRRMEASRLDVVSGNGLAVRIKNLFKALVRAQRELLSVVNPGSISKTNGDALYTNTNDSTGGSHGEYESAIDMLEATLSSYKRMHEFIRLGLKKAQESQATHAKVDALLSVLQGRVGAESMRIVQVSSEHALLLNEGAARSRRRQRQERQERHGSQGEGDMDESKSSIATTTEEGQGERPEGKRGHAGIRIDREESSRNASASHMHSWKMQMGYFMFACVLNVVAYLFWIAYSLWRVVRAGLRICCCCCSRSSSGSNVRQRAMQARSRHDYEHVSVEGET
ncbi:hypothetical protein BASA61_001994 [Batrachochytrium salamandrivorans]|nr:hypothetical protein BASA61_001994 [Batrachochytrium salamandrivorans]